MSLSITKFDWGDLQCMICGCLMRNHSDQSISLYGGRCREAIIAPGFLAAYPKVKVYHQTYSRLSSADPRFDHMWVGGCTACFKIWAYWGPGPSIGYALHHIRQCERFRYARSLDPTYKSPVSLRQRLSSSSGRQRTGDPASSDSNSAGSPPSLRPSLTDLARIFAAPFGRCKVCKEPLQIRFHPETLRAISYCPHTGVSHP